jgi:outer membrane protein assembly factor BamB
MSVRSSFHIMAACFVLLVASGADWWQFRGAENRSLAPNARLPIAWDKQPNNIAWKAKLPGRGVSSPIVVAGRAIVTCASGVQNDRLHVLAFDVDSGKLLWERQFWATGRTFCHPVSSIAAPTPASDGERIFALFSSNDMVCLDLDGNLQWLRGLTYESPTSANDVGMSSSPLVIGNVVIVQLESQGESFAAGLDTATGQNRWRIERPREPNWTSPTLLAGELPAADLVLLQSVSKLTAHDPITGKQVWAYDKKCSGIPSCVASEGVVYVPSAGLTALRAKPGASEPEVLWTSNKLDPGNSSPVVFEGRLYVVNRAGAMNCADAATGEVLWRVRLKGPFWATPILAGEHLYFVNHDGLVQVVRLGKEGEIVGKTEVGEPILGSPAVADNALYLRSDAHLWKIAAKSR